MTRQLILATVSSVAIVFSFATAGEPTRESNREIRGHVRQLGLEGSSHNSVQADTSTCSIRWKETEAVLDSMCNLHEGPNQDTAALVAGPRITVANAPDYAPAIDKLRAAVEYEMQAKQLPAFSISLVAQQQIIWADGFGFVDVDKKVPATADSVYRVGSVSKLFTDIAVMQLVEQDELNLDAPIQDYVPTFHPQNQFGTPITLRQLMSHRSGLVRESPVGNYFDPTQPSLRATVDSLNSTQLVYRPETKTKYSNAAVALVGLALESLLDVSHAEFVEKKILDPLEMNSSSFEVTSSIERKIASGWMRTYDGRRFEAPRFLLGTGPAGNLYSNVLDLAKFIMCLFEQGKTAETQILEPTSYRQMTVPVHDANGTSQGFGIGFRIQDLDGYQMLGHGGAIYGFSTQLELLPTRKLGVAAVTALDGAHGVVERLTKYALRLMIATQDGKPLPAYRTTVPLDPQRTDALIGSYREVDGDRFADISQLNGHVYMRRGAYRHEIRAAADDGSIVTDDEFDFGTEVSLPADGRLNVGDIVFARLKETTPPEIPEHWRGLIGEYGWDHNTLYILEEHGQLYALIEWFYYYPLKELTPNVYEFPHHGLYHGESLRFERSGSAAATAVVAAEVRFERRDGDAQDGEIFKIAPLKPINDLRSMALAASPPHETGEFLASEFVDLAALDPTIQLDIRYASTNNFMHAVFYQQARAFMQRTAAEAVVRANTRLTEHGLGLLVHDAYRPWHVTKMFWDATPNDLRDFVANPANGSRHNRGCAVDITLYDLKSGDPIQMVAGYDEFSPRSFPLYPGGTAKQRWYRDLLRSTMESEGFTVYEYEWWHFDYKDWKKYRIGNMTFEDLP